MTTDEKVKLIGIEAFVLFASVAGILLYRGTFTVDMWMQASALFAVIIFGGQFFFKHIVKIAAFAFLALVVIVLLHL